MIYLNTFRHYTNLGLNYIHRVKFTVGRGIPSPKYTKDTLIYQSQDSITVKAIYFALGTQTIFWISLVEMIYNDPNIEPSTFGKKRIWEYKTAIACSVFALLFPISMYSAGKKRVKQIKVCKGGQVVRLQNYLPFNGTHYYDLNSLHTEKSISYFKDRSSQNLMELYFGNQSTFYLDMGGNFTSDLEWDSLFFRKKRT